MSCVVIGSGRAEGARDAGDRAQRILDAAGLAGGRLYVTTQDGKLLCDSEK